MIRISGLNKSYGEMPVLKDLSMDIPEGKTTVILGPSGCGKTTLLNLLAGLDKDFTGKISGMKPGRDVSYCFQEDRLLDWMDLRANIEFVLDDRRKSVEVVDRYLEMLGLIPYRHFPVSKLSGGLRQRTAIARSLAFPSSTVLMDEPFRSIDHSLKTSIFEKLNRLLADSPRTIVIVTHDLNDALLLADRIYILSDKPVSVIEKKDLPMKKSKRDVHEKSLIYLKKGLTGHL